MKPPGKPFKAKDLEHPKAQKRSEFNGDLRRPIDEQGAFERRKSQGLTTVEGTRKPSNVRPVTHGKHAAAAAPLARELKRTEDPAVFVPVLRPAQRQSKAPELSDRQKQMLKRRK